MISNRDKRYISLALEESVKSDHHRIAIGAVIVVGNCVVGRASNTRRTHPRQAFYNRATNRECPAPRLHAEVGALVASGRRDVVGGDIFVGRFDRNGKLANCRPCPACWRALQDAGISRVVYTSTVGIKEEWL